MNKTKTTLFLLLFFLLLNAAVYIVSETNKEEKIALELNQKLETLKTHYKIILHNQTLLADGTYTSTVLDEKFMHIYSQTKDASPAKKDALRKELYKYLKPKYEMLAMQGVLQYQFVLPNTESFLRLHKPSRYGDSLLNIREDFTFTNATKLPVRGLTQGRVSHGFRNTYPIFSPDGSYLGAMEVSFSSDEIQNNLTNISKIHTHFLVRKTIFDAKRWPLNDLITNYSQSVEHEEYMLSINTNDATHYPYLHLNKKESFATVEKEMREGLANNKEFALYIPSDGDTITVASFLPVFNMHKTEILAWLVSYEKSQTLPHILSLALTIKILFFFIFFILLFLLYKLMLSNYKIAQEHKLINEILSTTDDIIFITDFEKVSFCNKKFKKFFSIQSVQEFEKIYSKSIDMFIKHDEYLDKSLLKKRENFAHLVNEAQIKNRVVLIRDSFFTHNSFSISVSNISFGDSSSYLVTLTDITKLKEHEQEILKRAYTDELTGIYNRAKLSELFTQELSRARRHGTKLSMTIIDIDNFKKFNDTFGHLVGDEVLVMLTKTLCYSIRDYDIFARWGGEEFVVVFPETSKEEAAQICDKLRVAIEQNPHPSAGVVSASFGVAQLGEEDTLETLFERCDKALYRAKENGRNRVELI